ALDRKYLDVAEEEMAAARRSDPTRPSYSAGLALARATRITRDGRKIGERERGQIIELCGQALNSLAGAFFPSRDKRALKMVADVYGCMGGAGDLETAEQLRLVAGEVDSKLKQSISGASVSGIVLEVLQSRDSPLSEMIGQYGKAAQRADAGLREGTELSKRGKRVDALTKFRQALKDAERATSFNPLSTLAWETLGDVHRELSDFQNARTAWKQALGFDPDNPRLYDKIGSSYWHIAFQGGTGTSRDDLEQAAERFDKALSLYGSGSEERMLTHYRLGKLNAALREFEKARVHLDIVEAAGLLPVLGWGFLAFAYLERRNFSECEYYFGRVIKEGEGLSSQPADFILGDRLDEQLWPLGLIRAWGHVGLAISLAERDGDLAKADTNLDAAFKRLDELKLDDQDPSRDERFPTRAMAAIMECRGLIRLREGNIDEAIDRLEEAVRRFPHSRAYFELALALEQRAVANLDTRKTIVPRAQRLLDHAVRLGPTDEPSAGIRQAMERLARLNGAPAA
ncbi:MAG: tetratricopeptide repeat protein, partial [Actinobacteria bacterium]|nr:tetratricopeptide repeat protein [Actinomycetota bacterium]